MRFILNRIYSLGFFQEKSSVHFSNSNKLINDGISASGEATLYALNAAYNVVQVGMQVGIGAICALEVTKNGVYVNSAVSSDSKFKPFIRNFLVFTADNPLITIGIGAAAMIVLNPDPTINACKNIAGTVYKLGETTIDITLATKEGLIGVILLTKEKANVLGEYLKGQEFEQSSNEMWHILEKISLNQLVDLNNDMNEWLVIEDVSELVKETMKVLNKLYLEKHASSVDYSQDHTIDVTPNAIIDILGDDTGEWTEIPF